MPQGLPSKVVYTLFGSTLSHTVAAASLVSRLLLLLLLLAVTRTLSLLFLVQLYPFLQPAIALVCTTTRTRLNRCI
jgi:hypothetical protein